MIQDVCCFSLDKWRERFVISAKDQNWDQKTLDQLRKDHNIIFMTSGNGVTPVMIVDLETNHPCLALGTEDDGVICFDKSFGTFDLSFSVKWAESLIADLQEAVRIVKSRMDKS